jgi:signal transduction histidine kinase
VWSWCLRWAAVPLLVVGVGVPLRAAAQAAQEAAAATSLPLLTTIKAIRALSQDEGARGYPVRVAAIVTHYDEALSNQLVVHDGEFGQWVVLPSTGTGGSGWPKLSAGDLIELEGRTIRGGFAPNVAPARIRKLGRAPLPRPRSIPYAALVTGRHDCDYIEIEGVVQRTWLAANPHPMYADVVVEGGVVRAIFWDFSREDLHRLVDARVRLRGNAGTLFGPTEQLRGVSLFAGRTRDLTVLEPAPDPFALSVRSIRSMYNYSADGEVNRRIRIRGVVTAYIPGRPIEVSDFSSDARFRYVRNILYVRDSTSGARVETEQAADVKPGDVVEVAGFPAVTPGKPILKNAVFRVLGREIEPAPMTLADSGGLAPDADAELVRMDASLLSILTSPTERVLVLKRGETVFEAGIDRSKAGPDLDAIRSGSLVSIVGVYSYQWGPPPSFRLFLRAPADVAVLAAASWWTLRHTVVMVVMLLAAACVGVVWARAAARRKRQEYQAVLSERNRVARELHDTLEQGLAGIALQLEAVSGSLEVSPDVARQSLDVARQMLRYGIEEARRSVMDLRSQALERSDLVGALTRLAYDMTTGTSTTARVHVSGEPQRLDVAQEHHLLRIGLEGLANALKHANADRIDIELRFRGHETDLVVRDDGRGLRPRDAGAPDGHFGLQGVRERVDKLGGRLQIDSEPGAGTQLIITVPVRRRATAAERASATA